MRARRNAARKLSGALLWIITLGSSPSLSRTPGASAVAQRSSAPDGAEARAEESGPSASDEGGFLEALLPRLPPAFGSFEVGGYAGLLYLSDRNSFRGPAQIEQGRTVFQPYSTFEQPAAELGLRGAYFPLSFLGAELEAMAARARTDRGNAASVLGARAHVVLQAPLWRVVPFATAGAGYWQVISKASGEDTDPAFHLGVGLKLTGTESWSLRLDVRDTITNRRAIGGHPNSVEILAGASWVIGQPAARAHRAPERAEAPTELRPSGPARARRDGPPPPAAEQEPAAGCPSGPHPTAGGCGPGDASRDEATRGPGDCPEQPGVSVASCADRDGDGVFDREDRCPATFGPAPLGCPVDGDGDGLIDPRDRCPFEPETVNAFEDDDGCPDELPEAVREFSGVIAGIEFDVNRQSIRADSRPVVDEAARILAEYPDLRVTIVGHTDDTGAREHNLQLSLARAEAVKARLVATGISPDRITTRGAGPDEPLATEPTEEARQKNRRIEFRIAPNSQPARARDVEAAEPRL